MNESQFAFKDPICGMTVDKATSLQAQRDDQTFYFCSDQLPARVPVHARQCQAGG